MAAQPVAGAAEASREEPRLSPSQRRRRRSASLLPPLPSPADVPEDALGRVAILALVAPPDVVPSTGAPLVPASASSELPAMMAPLPRDSLQAWYAVALLGLAMIVVFAIGVLVAR